MFLKDYAQISSQRNQILCICPDDVTFRSDAQLYKHHPSRPRELSFRTFVCVEPSNCSNLHLSRLLSNTSGRFSVFDKLKDFLPKHKYGKTIATFLTMCVPVRTLSFIRLDVHTKFNRPNVRLHGLDAQVLYMEIVCISSIVLTSYFMVQTLKALIWELRLAKVRLPDARATPFGHGSIQERISSKFGKLIAQLSVRTPSATIRAPPR
jgi:hypothetical protein